MKYVMDSIRLLPRHHRVKYGLLVLTRALAQILDFVGILSVGWIILLLTDQGQVPELTFLPASFSKIIHEIEIVQLLLLVATLFLLKTSLSAYLLWLTTRYLAKLESEQSSRVVRTLFGSGLEKIRHLTPGEVAWTTTSSTNLAFSVVLFYGSALVAEGSLFLLVIAAFFFFDPALATGVLLFMLSVVALYFFGVNLRQRRLGQRLAAIAVSTNNVIFDMLKAFREISTSGAWALFFERFSTLRSQHANDQGLHRFLMTFPRFFMEASVLLGGALLGVVLLRSGSPQDAFPTLGVFLAGGVRAMAALLPLQNALTELKVSGPQAARALRILRQLAVTEKKTKDHARPRGVENLRPGYPGASVSFSGVSFEYEDAKSPVLSNVSFKIPPGNLFALIGPSGSGKSTTADLLLGLLKPSEGSVSIEDERPEVYLQTPTGGVGYVPQKPAVLNGSLLENIALGIADELIDEERVKSVVGRVGLDYEELQEVSEGGGLVEKLSGGQVQRLGIARALYREPSLLVLDEATSALDAKAEASITSLVESLKENMTQFVIAHRLSTVQKADQVGVLLDGRLHLFSSLQEASRALPEVKQFIELLRIAE